MGEDVQEGGMLMKQHLFPISSISCLLITRAPNTAFRWSIGGLLCVLFLFTGAVSADGAEKPLKVKGAHPRLFFTDDQIATLKERIKSEPAITASWSDLLDRANSRGGIDALPEVSLAWRVTGEQRYAEKARNILLGESRRRDWYDAMLMRRDPPWHSGLGTGHKCFMTAIGFDSVYDFLSVEDRRTIAKGIVDNGILPVLNDWVLGQERIHTLDTMGHNWWSLCVFHAGIAAMAVMNEEPRAQEWLQRISEASVEWFQYAGSVLQNKPANFDAEGGFYESPNYAYAAVGHGYLFFRLAWSNAFVTPPPQIPLLHKVGDFFIQISCLNSGGGMRTVNFGDGTADVSRVLMLLWANGFREPRYLWYLNETNESHLKESIWGLVYYPGEAEFARRPTSLDLPLSALFKDMGWAVMRSSWQKDSTLLAVKSGFTWNHAHADAGSFQLYHRGKYLLIDSGNCTYGRPEYDNYYRQSQAHNVVLFNGQAENPEDTYFGSKFVGTVSHLMDTGDLKYVMADATGPTSQLFIRNYRHFLWLGDIILIIDDLKTFEPGEFEWLLHVDGDAKQNGRDLRVTQDGVSVYVRPLFPMQLSDAGYPADFPENMRLLEKTGLKHHKPDTKVPYYAFSPTEVTRRTKFITAVFLVDDTNRDNLPRLERLEGTDYIGVRIHQKGETTDVYLNLLADGRIKHRNSNITINGWETDAYLSAITFRDNSDVTDPDAASRYFLAHGSYLRRDGKVIVDSLSKVFLSAEPEDDGLNVLLHGQPVMNVMLRSARKPSKVLVNREAINTTYDAIGKVLKISISNE